MDVNVRVQGLEELERKLGVKLADHPAIEEAIETIGRRPERTRKSRQGLGIRNNRILGMPKELGWTVSTTLQAPRRTGAAWLRYNIPAMRRMAPGVIKKAAQRLEAEFNEGGPAGG